jgi:hypothetical protein
MDGPSKNVIEKKKYCKLQEEGNWDYNKKIKKLLSLKIQRKKSKIIPKLTSKG